MATSSQITITELTGLLGSEVGLRTGRTLILVGPGLPLMGADWGGQNNVQTTWYPGNGDEATQQMLGPQEVPSSWNGKWSRVMLGSPGNSQSFLDEAGVTSLIRPKDIADAFEELARGGQRLRVTWSVRDTANAAAPDSFKIVREGRAKTWKFKFVYGADIEWEIQFEWLGRGQQTQRVADTRPASVAPLCQDLLNKVNALKALNTLASQQKLIPQNITLGQLEQLASLPTKLVTQYTRQVEQLTTTVGQVVDIANTIKNQPLSVANAVVNQAHNCISQANNFRDTLGRTPYEVQTTQQNVGAMLRAGRAFSQQSDASGDVARSAVDLARQLRITTNASALTGAIDPRNKSGPNTIIAAYVTKDGDTPQRVSLKFYGTVDHAIDILKANRLPYYQPSFVTGKVLIIPVLQPQGVGTSGNVGA